MEGYVITLEDLRNFTKKLYSSEEWIEPGSVVRLNKDWTSQYLVRDINYCSSMAPYTKMPSFDITATFKIAKMKFKGYEKIYHYFVSPTEIFAGDTYETFDNKTMICEGFVFPWFSKATKRLPAGKIIFKSDEVGISVNYLDRKTFEPCKCHYNYYIHQTGFIDNQIVFNHKFANQCVIISNYLDKEMIPVSAYSKEFTKESKTFLSYEWLKEYYKHTSKIAFVNFIKRLNNPNKFLIDTVEKILFNRTVTDFYEENKSTSIDTNQIKGEKNNMMNNMFKNIRFGKIETDKIKFSMNGIAFKDSSSRTYHTYNIEKNELTDVTAFIIDCDFVFEVPVAIKDIEIGDVINHKDRYVIIKEKYDDNSFAAVDPIKAEEITILPVKNIFGFNYVSKVINIFEGIKAEENNPFGNLNSLLPLMMMKDDEKNDIFTMMMWMNAASGSNAEMNLDFTKNPLMLMAFCK